MRSISPSLRLVWVVLVLGLAAVPGVPAAHAQITVNADAVLNVNITGPQADDSYHFEGTVTVNSSTFGELNWTHRVDVYVEFMGPGGRWPVFYESYSIADACHTLGASCLTDEEVNGDILARSGLLSSDLPDSEQGKALPFSVDVVPPMGAVEMRVVAHYETIIHGNPWPAFFNFWDKDGPQSVIAPQPPTETPVPPTLTPTATPAPCSVTISPSPAYVMPGGDVEIHGTAVMADGKPIANAAVEIELGGLDGSMYVSQANTDGQGNFRYLYAAPDDVGGVQCVNLTVRVAGCPVSANSTICFTEPPTETPLPSATPTPATGTPTGSPTSTPTATDTPTATPTPKAGDLSIARVVLLQAVEGGILVGGRAVGVRVFFDWAESSPAEVEVEAKIDGQAVPPARGQVKSSYTCLDGLKGRDAINLVLPASFSEWLIDQNHTLEITARLVNGTDTDPSNNTAQVDFETRSTWDLPVLFVSVNRAISGPQLVSFAREVRDFLNQVYPITRMVIVPGAYLVELNVECNWVAAAIKVEEARGLYNSNRCKTPTGATIPSCDAPYARVAVGAYPDYQFGQCIEGFLFGRGGNLFKDEGAKFVFGGTVDRAALCRVENPFNVAHEIGHSYGLGDDYDKSTGSLGKQIEVGVSTWQFGRFRTENPGSSCQPNPCYNFMGNASTGGYAPGCNVALCTWVNAPTWNRIFRRHNRVSDVTGNAVASLGPVGAPVLVGPDNEIAEPALLIGGTVDAQGQAVFHFVNPVDRYESRTLGEGEWTLEALDADNNLLARLSFGLTPDDRVEENPFIVALPAADPAQVAKVQLSRAGQPVTSLQRSSSAPTVTLDPLPSVGDDPVTVGWQAQDDDGEALHYALLYTSNGGHTWQVLGAGLTETSLEVDPATLSGGEVYFKVVASDGLNEAEAVSPPISLPDRSPLADIGLPWGDTFAEDESVILTGFVYDPEDGALPDGALQWLDQDGQTLGQGAMLELTDLPSGRHTIALVASDSKGQEGRAEVTVTVQAGASAGTGPGTAGIWGPVALSGAGLVALLCLVVIIAYPARRRSERVLVTLTTQAAGIREQVQAGHPQAGTVQPLTGQDNSGRQWSLDPLRGAWSVWDGTAWRRARRPIARFPWGAVVILIAVIFAAGVYLLLGHLGVVPAVW